MSLRGRVVLIVMALAAAAALTAFAVVVINARHAVHAETASALDAAAIAVRELARTEAAAGMAGVQVLRELRHVRIAIPGQNSAPAPRSDPGSRAPDWFVALVWDGAETRSIPFSGGMAVIKADPRDELAEAWSDAVALAWIAGGTLALLLLAVHLAVSRALAPLAAFSRALEALSRGERDVDPSIAVVPELAGIGRQIRALDAALSEARQENMELSRILMDLQDRERRELAREVHDELGPLLFGIRVDAHAIARAAATGQIEPAAAAGRADAIAQAAGQIRDLSRRILGRLRPMALDHLDLSEVLLDLMEGLRRQHPSVTFDLVVADELPPLGERMDLTVYRIVQESVLNALRHGEATRIEVQIAPESSHELGITVLDNGGGLKYAEAGGHWTAGHGTAGMRERVQAHGGSFRIAPRPNGGTAVQARLPLPRITEQPQLREGAQ